MPEKIEGIYCYDNKWWASVNGQLCGNDGKGFDTQAEAKTFLDSTQNK